VIQTCWFQEKVFRPLINKTKFFQDIPKKITEGIIRFLRGVLPLPEAAKNTLLGSIEPPSGYIEKKELDCDSTRLTDEHIALNRLFDRYGRKKIELIAKMFKDEGVAEEKKITMGDIRKLGKVAEALEGMSEAELESIARGTLTKTTKKLKDFKDLVKKLKTAPRKAPKRRTIPKGREKRAAGGISSEAPGHQYFMEVFRRITKQPDFQFYSWEYDAVGCRDGSVWINSGHPYWRLADRKQVEQLAYYARSQRKCYRG
jgi:hypothetical protein